VGWRLKVKVELFPARANLESFGLCTEDREQDREGCRLGEIDRDGRYNGSLLLGTILDDGPFSADRSPAIVSRSVTVRGRRGKRDNKDKFDGKHEVGLNDDDSSVGLIVSGVLPSLTHSVALRPRQMCQEDSSPFVSSVLYFFFERSRTKIESLVILRSDYLENYGAYKLYDLNRVVNNNMQM